MKLWVPKNRKFYILSLQFSFLFASNSDKISGRKGEENGGEGDKGEGDNEGIELFSRIRDFDEHLFSCSYCNE